ncbi:MAG: hypothetical protein GKR94_26880 [Gammaproteobacteria bacterium]|nr:hypothetical protein [Gammaproteobacteria bacterium]
MSEVPQSPDPVLRQQFLDGMGCAACTVNVVTTDGPGGRAGMTVSAMASVSADGPAPTLLICVNHEASAYPALSVNGVFCVNILRDDQSFISDTFAGRTHFDDHQRFGCAMWTRMTTGAPRVVDPLAAFDCRIVGDERVGTHHVFIGEVQEIFVNHNGNPLIYANRAYGIPARISRLRPEPSPGGLLRIGCSQTFGPYVVPGILDHMDQEHGPMNLSLLEGDQRVLLEALHAGDVDLALTYDVDIDEGLESELLIELQPYVLLAESHPLSAKPRLALADLADEPMILLDVPPTNVMRLLDSVGHQANVAYRAQSFEMVRGLVGRGLGYALLATKPASSVTYDGRALVSRSICDELPAAGMVMVHRAGAELPAEARLFAAHCRAFIKGQAQRFERVKTP